MIETESKERERLNDWAIELLGLERTSESDLLRQQAIRYLSELPDSSRLDLDLPKIEALYWLIHQRKPREFLIASPARPATINLTANIAVSDHYPVLQAALTAYIHAAPVERLEIAAGAKRQLDAGTPLERRQMVDRLRREFQWAPVAQYFFVYMASHAKHGRPISRACISKLVQTAIPTPTRQPKPKTTSRERLTQVALVGLLLFFVLMGVSIYRAANRPSRTADFPRTPRLSGADTKALAKAMSAMLLESVDVSPFEPESRSDPTQAMFIIHLLSPSQKSDSRSIPELLSVTRRYRWVYREQHLIRAYLAEHGLPEANPEATATISFVDDGRWRVSKYAEAEEILLVFLNPTERTRAEIERQRQQEVSQNPGFWKSTALDLSPEETIVVLRGDVEKTLEIDKKLYPDSQEFELVRRLRQQNAALDRSAWRAYGHHQLSSEVKP